MFFIINLTSAPSIDYPGEANRTMQMVGVKTGQEMSKVGSPWTYIDGLQNFTFDFLSTDIVLIMYLVPIQC